jgi:hypothetical protein
MLVFPLKKAGPHMNTHGHPLSHKQHTHFPCPHVLHTGISLELQTLHSGSARCNWPTWGSGTAGTRLASSPHDSHSYIYIYLAKCRQFIITNCKEHLVNMAAQHWTRSPKLYYIFCCILTSSLTSLRPFCTSLVAGLLNLMTHTLLGPIIHKLHNHVNNGLCLATKLSALITVNPIVLSWSLSKSRCKYYCTSKILPCHPRKTWI